MHEEVNLEKQENKEEVQTLTTLVPSAADTK